VDRIIPLHGTMYPSIALCTPPWHHVPLHSTMYPSMAPWTPPWHHEPLHGTMYPSIAPCHGWGHSHYHGWDQWSTSFILMYHTVYHKWETIFDLDLWPGRGHPIMPISELDSPIRMVYRLVKTEFKKVKGSKVIVPPDDRQYDSIIYLKVDNNLITVPAEEAQSNRKVVGHPV